MHQRRAFLQNAWKLTAAALAAPLTQVFTSAQATLKAAAGAKMERYLYFVFSNPVPGKEEQYNAWYDRQHIKDVVNVPGFISARRYVFADEQLRRVPLLKPKYLVIYTIETPDLNQVNAEVTRRLTSGETKIDPSFDGTSFQSAVYRIFRPQQKGAGGQPPDANPGSPVTYAQVVFGDAVQGMDAEFNKWYDTVHEPELLSVPGFVSGDRGILSDVQMGETRARSRYVALFEIVTPDLHAVLSKTAPKSPLSPAFDRDRTFGYTYQAMGPLVLGAEVRRQRSASFSTKG